MIVISSVFIVLFFVAYFGYQLKFYWLAWKIRGPLGLPFIGCVELFRIRNLLAVISKLRKSYNSPLTMWFGPICLLYVADPENVQRVLKAPECINKSLVYYFVNKELGSGLLSNKNPEWSSHRKVLDPTFKQQPLRQTSHLIFLGKPSWGRKAVTLHGSAGAIELHNHTTYTFSKMIFNPLYSSLMITKVIDHEHYKKYQKAIQNVQTFSEKCVEATSKQFRNVAPAKCSVITYAVDASRKGLLSTKEVINEINHMIVASYETISKGLLHIMTLLALHPEWQERLYEEIEEKFPDKDVELSFENIQDTPLIDMVIKESLRLLPVGVLIGRVANADFLLYDDVVVPKGTNIMVDIFSMHRDPKYWGADAMLFNPYRFLQDEISQKHPYVYIPFSKGLRNCIGWRYANLSMKVAVIKVVKRFRFATTLKHDELDVTFNVIAKLTHQPLFTIEDRSSQL